MAKKQKSVRPKARLPKGLQDVPAGDIRSLNRMLDVIRGVFESYGFDPLETPAFEYTDALGKFLPDQDRPNEGVFSFEDEDNQWLSLRYDLTAPLARYVAEHFDALPKPFRRYQTGPVWRNEKPGPGRFRQFTQFDADTVGTSSPAADAEMCMLAADTMQALGIKRGDYVIRVNDRRILDGVIETIGVTDARQSLTVMRAIDKLDRLGLDGVRLLLGPGRKDESGDFTRGAELSDPQIKIISDFLFAEGITCYEPPGQMVFAVTDDEEVDKNGWSYSNWNTITGLSRFFESSHSGETALSELEAIFTLLPDAGYGSKRIRFDPSVVRGLEYYTGPVFEAELTFQVKDDGGRPIRFGSVGGGGRYDGLVERFKGIQVPATGFSIGVSRLHSALQHLGELKNGAFQGPVIVLVMDCDRLTDYQKIARDLRAAGIRAEMYVGTSGMRAQMKYADKRCAPCVVIQGEDERARGEVMIKDLVEGDRLSAEIADNKEWREGRPAQFAVGEGDIVEAVQKVISRQTDSHGSSQETP